MIGTDPISNQPSTDQALRLSPAVPPTAAPPVLMADVRIQDFRGLSDLVTSLDPLTVFVGENNSGKTSFLQSLAVFFGATRATEDDLHVDAAGTRAPKFVIDVRFVPGEGVKFAPDVEARLVGRIQFPQDATAPQYFTMRAIGAAAKDGTGIELERRFLAGWAETRTSAAALRELTDRPGREHLSLVQFFMLDARRDLVEELRTRTSHWGRLLADLGLEPAERAAIEQALATVGDRIVASSPVLGSVKTGLGGVKDALGASVSDVAIAPVPGRVDDLSRAVDVMIQRPQGAALPLRLQGQGSRSLAAVMVFESFVRKRVTLGGPVSPLVVAAFEEPEAHLHPQAHRAMLGLIAKLDGQKLVSTHSPHVVRVADIHAIRSISRTVSGAPQCKAVPRKSNGGPTFAGDELANVTRFVQRNNGEILFARAVVVIEGDTEDFALPVFARHHWAKDPSLLAISFAHTDGAGNGKHVVRILEYLGVPWVLMADSDDAGKKGVDSIEQALGRSLTADELVRLPGSVGFDEYLIDAGYRVPIEAAIAEHYGPDELVGCRARWHGQAVKGGGTRDYRSPGWEERLVREFCKRNKGTLGQVLAAVILRDAEKHNLSPLPPVVREVFKKVDKWLK
ncbi:MAG: AAA family ATPase [Chloroflexi bacterium]|nr:AAA family ATPase [Chloroflexota bacterium]